VYSQPMIDLVPRAQRYATGAHRRIDQRRKYSSQPYRGHPGRRCEARVNVWRTRNDPRPTFDLPASSALTCGHYNYA